jgi:AcrR family transcriptional regulator
MSSVSLQKLKSMHDDVHHPASRMKADDRRELILAAATGVFGDYGYVGTTTDQVARAAGVSQPYVVRLFGTKEKLFVAVLERALAKLFAAFRGALVAPSDEPVARRMGLAYLGLLAEHGLLLSLSHSFLLGSDPVIGSTARRGFLEVYAFLREEVGFSPDECQQFLAAGMLSNTMIGLRMTDQYDIDPQAREVLLACFPEKLDVVLSLGEAYRPGPK